MVTTMAYQFQSLVNKSSNKFNFVQRAFLLAKNQPAIQELLGDNVGLRQSTFKDDFGKVEMTSAQIRVPIAGDKDQAFLYAYARRKDKYDSFRLYKLEARFSKVDGKKLLVLDRSMEDQATDDEWEEGQIELVKRKAEEEAKKTRKKTAKELMDEEKELLKSMTPAQKNRYYFDKMEKIATR